MDNEDAEEKDSKENSNHSRSNSLTLHPDKAVSEEPEPSIAAEKSDLFDYPIEELKARLKKIKQDDAETLPELNVIIFHLYRIHNVLKRFLFYHSCF